MNKYIKNTYDIKKDTLNWAIIKSSAYFKEEHKKKQSEMEIIDSYIKCMDVICEQIKNNFRNGMCILKTYSLCIPYLFICRHTIELILKKALEEKINEIKRGHDNSKLWEECKRIYKNKELSYYDELIYAIDILDKSGEKFRYAKDTCGNAFENKPIFLNVDLLNKDIKALGKELLKKQ